MPDAPTDLEALAACVLRADRPALADARAAVAGLVDPREAWLALVHRGLGFGIAAVRHDALVLVARRAGHDASAGQ
ncbi:hypothetical protein [Nannocystis pusilla]|uniref:hypothetical protein n=1 Tax=Nannocystis pusilla TaxID=889268 RepID=UPI003BF3F458